LIVTSADFEGTTFEISFDPLKKAFRDFDIISLANEFHHNMDTRLDKVVKDLEALRKRMETNEEEEDEEEEDEEEENEEEKDPFCYNVAHRRRRL
jgi:hypothetical protein